MIGMWCKNAAPSGSISSPSRKPLATMRFNKLADLALVFEGSEVSGGVGSSIMSQTPISAVVRDDTQLGFDVSFVISVVGKCSELLWSFTNQSWDSSNSLDSVLQSSNWALNLQKTQCSINLSIKCKDYTLSYRCAKSSTTLFCIVFWSSERLNLLFIYASTSVEHYRSWNSAGISFNRTSCLTFITFK